MNCQPHKDRQKSVHLRWAEALGVCLLSSMLGAAVLQGDELWEVSTRVDDTSGAETKAAVVLNASGYRLRVERTSNGSARCSFRLPDGSSGGLDGKALPTIVVDAFPPQSIVRWQASEIDAREVGDFMEVGRRGIGAVPLLGASARSVSFLCWKKLKDQASPTTGALRQLLDGSELTVEFQLSGGNPEGATFPLDGARAAIAEALGISADPSDRDLAQDQLLQFRVRYRRTTCYLLQGRKRQRRCIETVRECSLQSHDSVLSMLGCIEGN
jgi:hypothetical protein